MPIEGKVAEILDKHTLVANVGSNDGVEEGMKFVVLEEGRQILDPDTKEVLGTSSPVKKAEVIAKDVKDELTEMETKTSVKEVTSPVNFRFDFLKSRTVINQEELDTVESVPEDRTKVEVGDLIKEIENEDDSEDEEETQDSQ